jgi:hypothetical protein
MSGKEKCIVVRLPMLPEDEGRCFIANGEMMSRKEAQEWINNQRDQFFGPGCYVIGILVSDLEEGKRK